MRPAVSKLMLATLMAAAAGCGGSAAPPTTSSTSRPAASLPSIASSGSPATATSTRGVAPPASLVGQPASSIDSCALLSDAEIRLATGASVTTRKPSTLTQVFSSVCDIELDNAGSLTVSVLPSGGKTVWDESFEPFIGTDSGPLETAVPGLGDKAGQSGPGDELMVLKDDTLFDLLYIEFGRNDKAAVVDYLAQTVVAKLPCVASGCAGFTPLPLPSTVGAVDVCALLTDAQIQTATGFTPTGHAGSGAQGHDPSCLWTLKTGSDLPGADSVEIKLMSTGGKAQFDFLAGAYDPPLEHVAGLGDDAIKTATIPDGAFYVLIGDRLLTFDFSLPLSVDDPYALVQPLVQQAVATIAGSGR